MCGIFVSVDRSVDGNVPFGSSLSVNASNVAPSWLVRRGPDHQHGTAFRSAGGVAAVVTVVTVQASVLGMRQQFTPQPVPLLPKDADTATNDSQIYLCWNGEVYESKKHELSNDAGSLEETGATDSTPGDPSVSDTDFVANLLRRALLRGEDSETLESFLSSMAWVLTQLVNAEFALCVATRNYICFAKDPWGRRSLLTGAYQMDGNNWCLASVADTFATDMVWTEVPPGILFAYNVLDGTTRHFTYHSSFSPNPVTLVPRQDPSEALHQLLQQAVCRRIHGKKGVAILFSGGLDSVVLAALVLQEQDHVTLANISFIANDEEQSTDTPSAADTRAAVASYQELVRLFPNAHIDFQCRQVTWNEVQQERSRIEHLIHPKTTVMDLNISTAFWFAADTVKDRILLTGLGADEQMGGYGRHRKAWEKGGNAALREELKMDQDRLWERNLGRDDRVLSDTSKEARYPFLDTSVVQFLSSLDLDHVCDFNLPPGQGDKRILRKVAEQLGLTSASVAVKRAIQFGSRIAQVSDKKLFGSRRKASGEAQYNVKR